MPVKKEPQRMTLSTILKILFFLILFLQFAPIVLTNLKKSLVEMVRPKTEVGMLKVSGIIKNAGSYIKHIHNFLKSTNIKALLVKIDSPGGFSGSSQAIFNELKKFKEKKPVVVLVEDVCTSGAYYIASAGHYIIVTPSSMIGSIGTILGFQGLPLPNLEDLMDDWKIKFEYIQAGKFKTAGNLLRKNTPEELAHLQSVVDDTYNQFIKDIAQARGLSIEKKHEWADGKIFTGNQALKIKLVDKLGSMQDAIDELKKQAKIETEIRFIFPQKPTGLAALFQGEEYGTETKGILDIASEALSTIWNNFILKQHNRKPIVM
jgi:protease-4